MITEHLEQFNWTFKINSNGHTICFDETGVQRCGVRKTNGKPCKTKYGLYDTGRCNNHQRGAANKRGFDSPNTTHGRTSMIIKKMPSKLSEIFQEARYDPKLLDLDDNIAMMDTMLIDLLPRLHAGDYGQLWLDLKDTYDEAESNWRSALRKNNPEALLRFQEAFQQLGEYIKTGRRDWITRQELMKISDNKRALVKTVSDVEYKGENAITMSDFLAVMSYMENVFMRAISNLEPAQQKEMKQTYAEGLLSIVPREDAG